MDFAAGCMAFTWNSARSGRRNSLCDAFINERLDAIFERFVQADLTITKPYEGSGLGLSIAKAYAAMLDGKIWVESEEGKGSTFWFSMKYEPVVNRN
jgi:signal transduction histidine kinase